MSRIDTRYTPSTESLAKIRELFIGESMWSVDALVKETGLAKSTTRAILKILEQNGIIESKAYKHRVGKIYTPVAKKTSAVRFGSEFLTLPELIKFLDENEKSPFKLITQDKWSALKILFTQVIYVSRLENVRSEPLHNYVKGLQGEMIELVKMLSSMAGDDFWSPVARANIDASLASMEGVDNIYADLKAKFEAERQAG